MPSLVQPSRSEFKFEIEEGMADEIKRYLSSKMQRDAHSRGSGRSGYPVCSVYLDSSDALLCCQTIDGKRNRYKLRVRVYDDNPSHPAFLEIKRRDGQIIRKQRATVDRATATAILSGDHSCSSPLLGGHSGNEKEHRREWMAFHEFCRLRDKIRAVGTTYVSYFRDAYVSPVGLEWRATFDRELKAEQYNRGALITIPRDGTSAARDDLVVFELKFTNKFPRWMQDLVRVFNLSAVSFPKYVNCLNTLESDAGTVTDRRLSNGLGISSQQVG